jgi:hypothetical protein
MDHSMIFATIYVPLITAGIVFVITWGMSNAGTSR